MIAREARLFLIALQFLAAFRSGPSTRGHRIGWRGPRNICRWLAP